MRKIVAGMIVLGSLWGVPAYADHDYYGEEYDDRNGSGNEGEYRDDNRRAGISPGPFDRSPVDFRNNRVTICFPFARCDSTGGEEEQPNQPPIQQGEME